MKRNKSMKYQSKFVVIPGTTKWSVMVITDNYRMLGDKINVLRKKDGKMVEVTLGTVLEIQTTGPSSGRFFCSIAKSRILDTIEKPSYHLIQRPNTSFDEKIHTTYPTVPIPEDDGSIPFDPPYV